MPHLTVLKLVLTGFLLAAFFVSGMALAKPPDGATLTSTLMRTLLPALAMPSAFYF